MSLVLLIIVNNKETKELTVSHEPTKNLSNLFYFYLMVDMLFNFVFDVSFCLSCDFKINLEYATNEIGT